MILATAVIFRNQLGIQFVRKSLGRRFVDPSQFGRIIVFLRYASDLLLNPTANQDERIAVADFAESAVARTLLNQGLFPAPANYYYDGYDFQQAGRGQMDNTVDALQVVTFSTEAQGLRWDEFVARHPGATNYHQWGWKGAIETGLDWPTYYFVALRNGRIEGVLPIVWQKSLLFGSFLTSLPFLNAGGILANGGTVQKRLAQEGVRLCQRLNAGYLEFRHRELLDVDLPSKSHKLTVTRPVNGDSETMFRQLHNKVRTDIRKAMKSGLESEVGSIELLDDFYKIFAQNMRDLGTPVYGRKFFEAILNSLPNSTLITVVRHRGKAVASSFLTGFQDTIEAAWSSSLKSALALKPNMLLYWRNLCAAGERGYKTFDFGRSSPGSGTHRFKMQWGGTETPLHWQYWVPGGAALPEISPQNSRYHLSIRVWQKMPLFLTNWIGPHIVRCLP
jgi:FemAB-related protein (PEP-CTERM system-associated)